MAGFRGQSFGLSRGYHGDLETIAAGAFGGVEGCVGLANEAAEVRGLSAFEARDAEACRNFQIGSIEIKFGGFQFLADSLNDEPAVGLRRVG